VGAFSGVENAKIWGSSPEMPKTGSPLFVHLTALEEAEMAPGKHSDTGIKPLALTSDHGRYIIVSPERALASVGECPLNI
jgi:hypothetical protein